MEASTQQEKALHTGRLVSGYGGFYTASDFSDGAQYLLRCRKKLRHQRMTPLIGDKILFTPGTGEEEGWLEEILPRQSSFVRPPVANATLMLITLAPVPQPDMLLVDRLMVQAFAQQIRVFLVVSKTDLDQTLPASLERQYRQAGVPVYPVSAYTGEGLDQLREGMRGEVCCLAGQSGVGKSTLLNALLSVQQETGEISRKIQRGKNTTRKAELLSAGDLQVFDTAGFSLLEMQSSMDPVALREYYPDFEPYLGQCRFEPCCHDREPGCAVSAAAQAGAISPERLDRYRQLLKECRERWKSRYD